MKSIPKTNISFNFYHLRTSTVFHPISSTFFSHLFSFDSRVFIFFVFCISSNNRSSHWRCSVKKVSLKISQSSQESICARAKETLTHMFLYKFLWNFQEQLFSYFFTFFPPDNCLCNKLNSMSCGFCLSFKSRHFKLF